MVQGFKTKEKAYYIIGEEEQLYEREHYCPLLQNNCNTNCVCFNKPRVYSTGKGERPWKVSKEFGCTNKMFFQEIK